LGLAWALAIKTQTINRIGLCTPFWVKFSFPF
jgi:hypothetical protein